MRVLVVWCPDWAVVAGLADAELPPGLPAAVLAGHRVEVVNAAARADGVRRGMRRRDAQARCPELVVLTDQPDRDARAFEPVLAALEAARPGVAPIRPGLVALRAPGRYYGGEPHAAALMAQTLVEAGVWDVRIGIADDLFTAEQAARQAAPQEHVVVPPGGAAAFLRPLPVEVLATGAAGGDAAEVVSLLGRLGIRTLGDFAALPGADVSHRFGRAGHDLWQRARGEGPSRLAARTPPPELACEVGFEPPLEDAEAVCFSVRTTTERFVAGLANRQLVPTAVRVEVECAGDRGESVLVSARSWLHPRSFSARDLVDRVHWQIQGQAQGSVRSRRGVPGIREPVTRVRFVPEVAEPAGDHAEGLWGGGAGELVARGMARVQAMLGYDAVLVPVAQGGRGPAARQACVPWGERPTGLRPLDRPWPGQVPGPAPARVFAEPPTVAVRDQRGVGVRLDARGAVSGEPATVQLPDSGWQPVQAWAGPWPADEGWWEQGGSGGLAARFQVVGVDGRAWLLCCRDGVWELEAAYD